MKLLITLAIAALAAGDVSHLNQEYLPPNHVNTAHHDFAVPEQQHHYQNYVKDEQNPHHNDQFQQPQHHQNNFQHDFQQQNHQQQFQQQAQHNQPQFQQPQVHYDFQQHQQPQFQQQHFQDNQHHQQANNFQHLTQDPAPAHTLNADGYKYKNPVA